MFKKFTLIAKTLCLLIVICLGGFLFALSNQIAGFRAFVVLSGSMEPTLKVGSLVITKLVSPRDLGPLDIITFVHPQNPKEFITHRILNVNKVGNVPVFKTMGDNNPSMDSWTVVGGSVVGKIVFSIPYAGFIISVTRGKLAIVLLIILPSVFLISEEIRNIFKIIKSSRPAPASMVSILLLLIGIGAVAAKVSPTRAILSDTVSLTNNTFSVLIPTLTPTPSNTPQPTPLPTSTPTPTLSPTPVPTVTITPTPKCPPNTSVEITGNGAGSTNEVVINSNCTTTVNQHSSLNSTIEVNSNSTSGGNTSSQNSSNVTISTSSSSSNVSVTVTQ